MSDEHTETTFASTWLPNWSIGTCDYGVTHDVRGVRRTKCTRRSGDVSANYF